MPLNNARFVRPKMGLRLKWEVETRYLTELDWNVHSTVNWVVAKGVEAKEMQGLNVEGSSCENKENMQEEEKAGE